MPIHKFTVICIALCLLSVMALLLVRLITPPIDHSFPVDRAPQQTSTVDISGLIDVDKIVHELVGERMLLTPTIELVQQIRDGVRLTALRRLQ